jgi:transcriptional regulator with XRE-family HTH domain
MQKLAEKSGISFWCIYNYEKGKNEPGMHNLIVLADALEISLDEYVGREIPKKEDAG